MSEQALQRHSRAVRHMEPAGVVALAESHAALIATLEDIRSCADARDCNDLARAALDRVKEEATHSTV